LFKCANDISQFLRDRILELLRYGVKKSCFLVGG